MPRLALLAIVGGGPGGGGFGGGKVPAGAGVGVVWEVSAGGVCDVPDGDADVPVPFDVALPPALLGPVVPPGTVDVSPGTESSEPPPQPAVTHSSVAARR